MSSRAASVYAACEIAKTTKKAARGDDQHSINEILRVHPTAGVAQAVVAAATAAATTAPHLPLS